MITHLYTYAAKVRRLYDIANVLSSMNLIEKVLHFFMLQATLKMSDMVFVCFFVIFSAQV